LFSQMKALVESAHVGGAVTEEAERDVALVAIPGRERHAGGDRHVAAHDRPASEEAVAGVEEMHRATPAADAAGRLAVELRHRPARVARPRQVVRVLAVRGHDVVARLRRRDRPDGDRLLPDVEVQEAADLPLRVGARRGLLEAPAETHLPIEIDQQLGIHDAVADYR
jgi:hypothetical protein